MKKQDRRPVTPVSDVDFNGPEGYLLNGELGEHAPIMQDMGLWSLVPSTTKSERFSEAGKIGYAR